MSNARWNELFKLDPTKNIQEEIRTRVPTEHLDGVFCPGKFVLKAANNETVDYKGECYKRFDAVNDRLDAEDHLREAARPIGFRMQTREELAASTEEADKAKAAARKLALEAGAAERRGRNQVTAQFLNTAPHHPYDTERNVQEFVERREATAIRCKTLVEETVHPVREQGSDPRRDQTAVLTEATGPCAVEATIVAVALPRDTEGWANSRRNSEMLRKQTAASQKYKFAKHDSPAGFGALKSAVKRAQKHVDTATGKARQYAHGKLFLAKRLLAESEKRRASAAQAVVSAQAVV